MILLSLDWALPYFCAVVHSWFFKSSDLLERVLLPRAGSPPGSHRIRDRSLPAVHSSKGGLPPLGECTASGDQSLIRQLPAHGRRTHPRPSLALMNQEWTTAPNAAITGSVNIFCSKAPKHNKQFTFVAPGHPRCKS